MWKYLKQELFSLIRGVKEGAVRGSYFLSITVVIVAYLMFNIIVGAILVMFNYREDILVSITPLYTAESLALTFYACTSRAQKKVGIFRCIKNRVDIINVLALTTAIIATVISMLMANYIAATLYAVIIIAGFKMIISEICAARRRLENKNQ